MAVAAVIRGPASVVDSVSLAELMAHMATQGRHADLAAMQAYRDSYGLKIEA